MRTIKFGVDEYYHLYARGVDKRDIFEDDRDRRRFMRALLLANNGETGRLVDLVAYVLMDNHYHLVVRQVQEKGVSELMRAIGNSYVKYFNKRHDRVGRLFSSPYKAKHVDSDAYLQQLIRYVHRNPLNVILGIVGLKQLELYEWSSYRHWLGLECQLSVHSELANDFSSFDEYRQFMMIDDDTAIESYVFEEN